MTAVDTSFPESQAAPKRSDLFGGWLPGRWTWLIVVLCGTGIAGLQYFAAEGDQATHNIFTLILGFAIFVALGFWFVVFSAYPRPMRLLVPVAVAISIAVWFAFYEVGHVDGFLIPHWRRRGALTHDQRLSSQPPAAITTGERVDLMSTTAHDFPQFLGPNRDLKVVSLRLDQNWDTRPPRQVWQQPVGAGWSSFVAVNGFAVTMEQRGEEELVTCYEVATGKLRWSHAVAGRHETKLGGVGPRSTPTIHEGRVYAFGPTGILRCLNGEDGSLVWQFDVVADIGLSPAEDLQSIAWGRAHSPLIVDEKVVIPYGGSAADAMHSLAALHKDTGDILWKQGEQQVAYASPQLATLADHRQILLVSQDWVGGYDADDGRPLWTFQWPGSSQTDANTSQAMPAGDDRVLLSKGYGGGAKLLQIERVGDQWKATELWHSAANLKTKFTNAVIVDDAIYALSDGILECVDLESGERNWKNSRGRYGHGQILLVGDVLLVQAEMGDVAMVSVSPDGFQELGRFPALEGKTWNNLCIYERYLLVRNAEQAACYELRLAE